MKSGADEEDVIAPAARGAIPHGASGARSATATWNRAATAFFGPNPGAGDRAAEAMSVMHGMIMSGGVLDAVEIMDQKQFEAAKAAYRYFGFDPVVDLLSRAKLLLERPTADAEPETILKTDQFVVELIDEDDVGQFEEELDSVYWQHGPASGSDRDFLL